MIDSSGIVQVIDFLSHGCRLGALLPNFSPVSRRVRSWCRSDYLEHPFGGIFGSTTRLGTIAFKIRRERLSILSDITKVDCSSSLGQEKKTVKLLEEHR